MVYLKNLQYLVITVCLSGRISNKIFLISGSKPMSNIRSASSKTYKKATGKKNCCYFLQNFFKHMYKIKSNYMCGTCTYQVGNWLHIHNFVHDQVIQSPRGGNNDFYSLGHNIDLLPSVASTIHTNTVMNKRPIDDIASLRCTSWLTNAFIIPAIMNVFIIPDTWFHFLPLKNKEWVFIWTN